MIELPYGRVPYPRDLGRTATVLAPPTQAGSARANPPLAPRGAGPSRSRWRFTVRARFRFRPRALRLTWYATHASSTTKAMAPWTSSSSA